MGTPTDRFTTHTFVISQNGTFAVSDDSGNSFAINPLGGLPSGTVTVSLKGNATEAVQNFLVGNPKTTVTNVTVVYSVKLQFCQPSGIKLTIKGIVNMTWALTSSVDGRTMDHSITGTSTKLEVGALEGLFPRANWSIENPGASKDSPEFDFVGNEQKAKALMNDYLDRAKSYTSNSDSAPKLGWDKEIWRLCITGMSLRRRARNRRLASSETHA